MAYQLFQQRSTGRYIPLVMPAGGPTPAEKYLPDLAREYGVPEADLVPVTADALPVRFEADAVPRPAPPEPPEIVLPADPAEQVRVLFPGFTRAQQAFLAGLVPKVGR